MLKTEAEKSFRVGKTRKIKIIMKKTKLNLKDLKIESFVTDLDNASKNDVKGGGVDSGVRTCWIESVLMCEEQDTTTPVCI